MAELRKFPDAIKSAEISAREEARTVLLGLSAAIVSVADDRPRVLVVHRSDSGDALPFGNFDPLAHRTLESGLRGWVEEQTGLQLGYVEQLYTFGDRGRHLTRLGEGPRVLSVGYLALTRSQAAAQAGGGDAPPDPDRRPGAADFCAICAALSLASSLMLPEPARLTPLVAHAHAWSRGLEAAQAASAPHLLFQARAPPRAFQLG